MGGTDEPVDGEQIQAATAATWNEAPTSTVPIILPVHQHPRVWMLLSAILGIFLIGAIVLAGYLWNVNGKWQTQVDDLTQAGYDLGEKIADQQKQLDKLDASNILLNDQLGTAKDRVLTLSNEKAQSSDDAAFAHEQVLLLTDQLSQGVAVANQLNRCVEGEQQLITYIRAGATYTPQEINAFESSVNALCTAAIKANKDLEQALTQ